MDRETSANFDTNPSPRVDLASGFRVAEQRDIS